jgi:2TM domain
MNTETQTPQDKQLWEIAKKRASFKRHLTSYVLVNLFLIGVWYFTEEQGNYHYFWPKWVLLGWGIGLVLNYFEAYQATNFFSAEKEYQNLKGKN